MRIMEVSLPATVEKWKWHYLVPTVCQVCKNFNLNETWQVKATQGRYEVLGSLAPESIILISGNVNIPRPASRHTDWSLPMKASVPMGSQTPSRPQRRDGAVASYNPNAQRLCSPSLLSGPHPEAGSHIILLRQQGEGLHQMWSVLHWSTVWVHLVARPWRKISFNLLYCLRGGGFVYISIHFRLCF